jgi:hypothetical protein
MVSSLIEWALAGALRVTVTLGGASRAAGGGFKRNAIVREMRLRNPRTMRSGCAKVVRRSGKMGRGMNCNLHGGLAKRQDQAAHERGI